MMSRNIKCTASITVDSGFGVAVAAVVITVDGKDYRINTMWDRTKTGYRGRETDAEIDARFDAYLQELDESSLFVDPGVLRELLEGVDHLTGDAFRLIQDIDDATT